LQPLQTSAISALSKVGAKLCQLHVPWECSAPRFAGGFSQNQPQKRGAMQMACELRNQHPCLKQRLSGQKTCVQFEASADEDEKDRRKCPSNRPELTKECGRRLRHSRRLPPLLKACCCCTMWAELRRAWPSPFWLPLCVSALPWSGKSTRTSKEFWQHSLVS